MTRELRLLNGGVVGDGQPVFIVAEIGQNHQGSLETALEMVAMAKSAGADAVKFQKTSLGSKFTRTVLERPYRSQHSWGDTYGEHKAHLEFSESDLVAIQRRCSELGLLFFSTAMDEASAELLLRMDGIPVVKVGSGDVNNWRLMDKLGKHKTMPLIISTGMADLEQVKRIYELMRHRYERTNFALLQCTSSYPTPEDSANLNVITDYKERFQDIVIGYSGHESGYVATLGAVALGAKIVERHFTLDKNQKGSDHKASLDYQEFCCMVKDIRTLERNLGSNQKRFLSCEQSCFDKLGKSVVAARPLQKGDAIQTDDLAIKVSDPKGFDPNNLQELIGKRLKMSLDEDQPIWEENIEMS